METAAYYSYLAARELEYEKACGRCGSCCGAYNDPCSMLIQLPDKTCHCKDYENHLGQQYTVSNRTFNCVAIKDLIKKDAAPPGCVYTKGLSNDYTS